MNVESYHKLRRIDRLQNVMKLRLAQAEQRNKTPICESCGERHSPNPVLALLRRLGDEDVAPTTKEIPNDHH